MTALGARVRACLDPRAFPYERVVCQLAVWFRIAHIVVPALAAWTYYARFIEGPVTAAAAVIVTLMAARCGSFLWADGDAFGWPINLPALRELATFTSTNPNLWSTCTEEDYAGFKRGGYADDDENEQLFNDLKFAVHAPWERSGQPRYDYLLTRPRSEWTWAQRLHWRYVRPRLRARGVPGY